MKLSTHFSLEELTFSETASRLEIGNDPDETTLLNLRMLCNELLEPIRELIGKPIHITSGYRSPRLNRAVSGSKTSEHVFGRAVDFRVAGMTPLEVCRILEASASLKYNQLILEFNSWTHISHPGLESPKREKLTATRSRGLTKYLPGIVA